MKTLIVIPTFLEAENITEILEKTRMSAPAADILVVDDNSTDGTADLAREVNEALGQIDVLVRPEKGGLGAAYRAGFEHAFAASYEVVAQMDADFSHDPAALPSLFAEIEHGASVAIGSRYVSGGSTPDWPLRRRMLSRLGNLYASAFLGLDIRDATAGYRAYRTTVLQDLAPRETKATGYGFQLELSYRARRLDVPVTEVPISFTDRRRGKSKMSGAIVAEAVWLIAWWAFRDRVLGKIRRGPAIATTPRDHELRVASSEQANQQGL